MDAELLPETATTHKLPQTEKKKAPGTQHEAPSPWGQGVLCSSESCWLHDYTHVYFRISAWLYCVYKGKKTRSCAMRNKGSCICLQDSKVLGSTTTSSCVSTPLFGSVQLHRPDHLPGDQKPMHKPTLQECNQQRSNSPLATSCLPFDGKDKTKRHYQAVWPCIANLRLVQTLWRALFSGMGQNPYTS